MKSGYTWQTVQDNVSELIHSGTPRTNAVAAAFALARKSFFKKHPGGALPVWLAFSGKRLQEYYSNNGTPIQENPSVVPNNKNMQRAATLYRDFTGKEPQSLKEYRLPEIPREGLVFGELKGIHYVSARDGGDYYHKFRKSSRPTLIATYDGKSVLIVGGRYTFTERGIEDR